jgi:hypothetical protein
VIVTPPSGVVIVQTKDEEALMFARRSVATTLKVCWPSARSE